MNRRRVTALWLGVLALMLLGADDCEGKPTGPPPPPGPHAAAAPGYLSLQEGQRWILRNPKTPTPVRLEVVGRRGNAYRLLFENPWSSSELWLEPRGGQIFLTGMVAGGKETVLKTPVLYWDLTQDTGAEWSNRVAKLQVLDRAKRVTTGSRTYGDCVQIGERSNGNVLFWTFAPGTGFVQFGEGEWTFLLDEAASSVAVGFPPPSGPPPVAPPPGTPPTTSAGAPTASPTPAPRPERFMLAMAATLAANQAFTADNLIKRFDQTRAAGVNMIFLSPLWNELEKSKGKIDFSEYDFWIGQARKYGIPIVMNLRPVDTNQRSMPGDLSSRRFDDPEVIRRFEALVDHVAPKVKGVVTYVMLGNEIDEYFGSRPNELPAYLELWRAGANRFRKHLPGVQVSATVTFHHFDLLKTTLRPLDQEVDFFSLTYYPLRPDFGMRPPDVVKGDFDAIVSAARGRPVMMQEIGYSSSPVCDSSDAQQAQFFDNVFTELKRRPEVIGANFFLMSDMSDEMVKGFGSYYQLPNAKKFLAYLQYLGFFDKENRPKPSWGVFQKRGPELVASPRR